MDSDLQELSKTKFEFCRKVGVSMSRTKAELVNMADEAAEKWLCSEEGVGGGYDIQPMDFIRFVNRELAPHMTKEALQKLIREYEGWLNI